MSSDDIKDVTYSETITDPPTTTVNEQGTNNNGDFTKTTFTTDARPDLDVNITQDLLSTVDVKEYNNTRTNDLLNQIKFYAGEIKCEDFHGKGSLDDYKELFIAASNISNEIKSIKLDVDVDGLKEFADSADELTSIFTSYITRLETITIIDDYEFLVSVSNSLKKIYDLSNAFAKFKQTIIATSAIHIPKTTIDACNQIKNVMGEIDCALGYINNFVSPVQGFNSNYELSSDEKKVINNAVASINNWTNLSDQGIIIAMENNPDIKTVKQVSANLKIKSNTLKNLTVSIKTKLSSYNVDNKPLLNRQTSN